MTPEAGFWDQGGVSQQGGGIEYLINSEVMTPRLPPTGFPAPFGQPQCLLQALQGEAEAGPW